MWCECWEMKRRMRGRPGAVAVIWISMVLAGPEVWAELVVKAEAGIMAATTTEEAWQEGTEGKAGTEGVGEVEGGAGAGAGAGEEDEEEMTQEDKDWDAGLYRDGDAAAEDVLSGRELPPTQSYLAYGWLGLVRYPSHVGVGAAMQWRSRLWWDITLGYGSQKKAHLYSQLKYERESTVYSLHLRSLYFIFSQIPIHVFAETGLHRFSHVLDDVYVFPHNVVDESGEFSHCVASLKFGLTWYMVLYSRFYVAVDVWSWFFQSPLGYIDTGMDVLVEQDINDVMRYDRILPPFNILVGYLMP